MTKLSTPTRDIDNRRLMSLVIGKLYDFRKKSFLNWEGPGEQAAGMVALHVPLAMDVQSQTRKFKYTLDGKVRYYTPDFEVTFVDGDIEFWEVRTKTALDDPERSRKLDAAEAAIRASGFGFRRFVSGELRRSGRFRNIRLLRRYVQIPCAPDTRTVLKALLAHPAAQTVGGLCNAASHVGLSRADVYHLMYTGEIAFELESLISDESRLHWKGL